MPRDDREERMDQYLAQVGGSTDDDIQRIQNMYRGFSQFAPQAKAQLERNTTGGQMTTREARQARQRFPTPTTATQPRESWFVQFIRALSRAPAQVIESINPFGQQAQVTQQFGNRNPQLYADVGGVNRGTDVRAQMGTPIRSPRDLRVADIRRGGWNTGWGNTVQLEDPRTQERFRFSHLSDVSQMSPGDIVRRGMMIGRSGQTGRTTGPHVDLEYQRGNQLADVSRYYPEWFGGRRG